MTITVQGVGSNTMQLQSGCINGLFLSLYATTVTDWTVASQQLVNLTATLYRGSDQVQVVAGNLYALAIAENPGSYEGQTINTNYRCFYLSFGGFINLKDGDNFQVNVTVSPTITGSVVTCATSHGVGIEDGIPTVQVTPVDVTKTNQSFTLGNGVTRISLVQAGQEHTLNSVNIASDYLRTEYLQATFNAMISNEWPYAGSQPANYSFTVYSGPEINGVQVNANVVTTATAKGYFVTHQIIRNKVSTVRTAEAINKVAAREAAKLTV